MRMFAARCSSVHALMADPCKDAMDALHKCKRDIGLLPRQCYPRSGYKGECDMAEYTYKRCLAFAANARDATLLYDVKAPRKERVEANKRLQKKLQKYHFECTP